MANLAHTPVGECSKALSNIATAREQRNRSDEIADWVMTNICWTIAVPDCADFHDRWPLLGRSELVAVEEELQRRASAVNAPDADLDAIAAKLAGRPSFWTAAADWVSLNPLGSITDAEFVRLFGQLSRAELLLAAIEHKRRALVGCNGTGATASPAISVLRLVAD
ncbi:MAG: hypothetical protein HEQ22_04280 [Sphingopyxis sp.]|uniref:hypothetical protein n=1 Tax=Sphingopyxis sp. TaxID=1908224 RepID=UPI003D811765